MARIAVAHSAPAGGGIVRVNRLTRSTLLGAQVLGSSIEGEGELPDQGTLYQAQRVLDALGEVAHRLDFYSDGEGGVEFSADAPGTSRLATVTSRPPFDLLIVPDDLASTVAMSASSTGAVAAFLAGGL